MREPRNERSQRTGLSRFSLVLEDGRKDSSEHTLGEPLPKPGPIRCTVSLDLRSGLIWDTPHYSPQPGEQQEEKWECSHLILGVTAIQRG